jgi:hypothetical protein
LGHEVAGFDCGICRRLCCYGRIGLENVASVCIIGFNQVLYSWYTNNYPNGLSLYENFLDGKYKIQVNLLNQVLYAIWLVGLPTPVW